MLVTPLAHIDAIDRSELNRFLTAWGHRMGPYTRPSYAIEAHHALFCGGEPVAVTAAGETVREVVGQTGIRRDQCGHVAVNLFRACKASERAKVYRGGQRGNGSYRGMAYDRKQWAMDNLCRALGEHAGILGISWGWGTDDKQPMHRDVLYVDLPTGQVSFHTAGRGKGPDYLHQWDGVPGQGPDRVCRWVARVLAQEPLAASEPPL